MSKKVVGIFLLMCLLVPMTTTFLSLQLQKLNIKSEVKSKMISNIERDDLTLLKFTKSQAKIEIEWEHSKEFEYKGEMYDVVYKEVIKDTLYYWCWWDHKETRLNKQLNNLVAKVLNTNPQREEKQHQLVYFFKNLFYDNNTYDLQPVPELSKRQFWYLEVLTSRYHSPPTPTPRSC